VTDPVAAPAIESQGLSKAFDSATAVAGIDLLVQRGAIFGLVGPDGAGKTTVMRMLSGVLPPSSGWARVCGHDVVNEAERVKRRIGYLPQRLSLYPELTVDEHIWFSARLRDVKGPAFEQRRKQLLSFSRLEPFRDRRAAHLSGGMRQKLALACALVHEPEVLILDEPTTGVDPLSRADFWQILLDLVQRDTTVLVSTAYMEEAERCTRVGLMHRGRLLGADTPAQLRRQVGLELLEVECDRVGTAREALGSVSEVIWAEVFGDRLHVATSSAQAATAPLREALERAGVHVESVQQIDLGLEDAFFEMVRRDGERAA
jgi:ABC-2 type transport system ATP-binding protein